ncbi:HAMP domain-containing sensor histidine kinase [Leptotrichia buccalis]|uniref:histidine kinase n=1 Tax=Leptotrichia buccalis (strain ATCC 14201 / DSM 1135 / JCM 12969 / NCTC 10249 / C-1013-b) TaxID=523794 RepID=C7NBE8_LEPBD|nr:HAMP domain-containing sensor histidine kinase [Leptotrichia buccalis]ACV39479.1 histidine kinase [Leptotrichia buccalis C-1013-b]
MKNKINKIWENFPITVKITLWYTAFIVILIAIMLTGSFTIADKMTGDLNQRELMESVVEMASEMVSNPDEFDDFDDGIYFVKYNNAGIEMAGMSPRGFDLTLNFSENTVKTYEKDGGKFYYFDKKINIPEGEWVRGIIPVNKLTNEVNRMLLIILISSPLLLLIIVYGGYKIIKKALNPVAKISGTASEIQKNGDFSKRIEIDEGKDEIHKMATAFNEMLNSLENSYIREKQFSSDVSHELRTPVSVILTESQYSLEYADTLEEAKDSFSVIQRQAKKMSELINQIMELSKIEKQFIIPTKKINFSEIIEKILLDYKNLIDKKNIKISKEIEENIFITGDKIMIERLLDNLLNNAMKFTKNEIKIKLYSENENCILEVEDNGIGMSEEFKNLIWGRFYQINDSRNKKINKGFGLGLFLVSKIIEQHNAVINVESELNKGTKFIAKFKKYY